MTGTDADLILCVGQRRVRLRVTAEYVMPAALTGVGDVPCTVWHGAGLTVLRSVDPTRHGDLIHLSVSRPDRDPTWAEIRAVRDALIPADMDAMLVLPQAADYVNLHAYCFHVWQTPAEWGMQ